MPHQCTNCGHVFPDGSKEMLSGCPACGGNKFQFKPGSVDEFDTTVDSSETNPPTSPLSSDSPASASPESTSPGSTPSGSTPSGSTSSPSSPTPPDKSTSADRPLPPETEGFGRDAEVIDGEAAQSSGEDHAQSTARSDVVSSSELTAAGSMGPQPTRQPVDATDTDSAATDPVTNETDAADTPSNADDSATSETGPTDDSSSEESTLEQLRKELNSQFESIRIVNPGQYELNLMELYDRDEYIISLREDGRYVIEVPDSWQTDIDD